MTDKAPCDYCRGQFHEPLEPLKYSGRLRKWLCTHCRDGIDQPPPTAEEPAPMAQETQTETHPAGHLGQDVVDVDKPNDDDLTLWSVTTIIDVMNKPALLYWAAEKTAEAAVDNLATWQAMLQDRGRTEAIKWLRDARFRSQKSKLTDAELGTIVHTLGEHYALTGHKPTRDFIEHEVAQAGGPDVDVKGESDVAEQMLDQFDGWLERSQPSYQATEVCVYNPTYGYAGQADAFATIDGVRLILDYKSSRKSFDPKGKPTKPYPEQNGLQLLAYAKADYAAVWRPRRVEKYKRRYYLLGATERELAVPVPEVDAGLIIKITPEHCESYPITIGDLDPFLYAIEMFRWVDETSKTIMREPLVFPERGE